MQLHQLSRATKKPRPRVGRGGKRGTTSGRGTKGQRSRAGHRIRPAIRDLVIRIPKRRGFRNKAKSAKPFSINITALVKRAAPLAKNGVPFAVDLEALKAMGLIPVGYRGEVKVLGSADVSVALALKGIRASKSAASKIALAGGTIQ